MPNSLFGMNHYGSFICLQFGRYSFKRLDEQIIKKSKIWHGIKKYALTVNMRADLNEIQYKNYQLQVGDGEILFLFYFYFINIFYLRLTKKPISRIIVLMYC